MIRIQQRSWLLMMVCVSFVFLTGCPKAKLVHSWADPDAEGYSFTKPIAVVVINDEDLRQTAEEAIVRNIKRVEAYPSYLVLNEGDMDDVEVAKKKLLDGGFDMAIVLRLLGIEDKADYVAASYPDYYYDYWNYYPMAWSSATYSPAYIHEERIIKLETTLFSIKDNKLLWVGVSESKNPETVSSLIDEVAEVIGKELRKKGVIQ